MPYIVIMPDIELVKNRIRKKNRHHLKRRWQQELKNQRCTFSSAFFYQNSTLSENFPYSFLTPETIKIQVYPFG